MKSFRKEDVLEKTVIETSGRVEGKVKDVVFDLSGTVTLIVEGKDGKESRVPLTRVTGISEHVVVRGDMDAETSASGTSSSCKFCGAPLTTGQDWCPKCGKSQS
jgi:sporulation protein YlmC with PRC-barrel domain